MHLITWIYAESSYVYYKGFMFQVKSYSYELFFLYQLNPSSDWKYISSSVGPLL